MSEDTPHVPGENLVEFSEAYTNQEWAFIMAIVMCLNGEETFTFQVRDMAKIMERYKAIKFFCPQDCEPMDSSVTITLIPADPESDNGATADADA